MITAGQVWGLAAACVVLIAVPGPSVMFIIGRALTYGRGSALASVAGNSTGTYLAAVVIALGLGPVLQRSETVFQVIKWAGVAYLIWLGIDAIRHAGPAPEAATTLSENSMRSPWSAARAGLVVGVTNPKAFIVFTAIVPQFIDIDAGHATAQLLVLGLVPITVGLLTDTTWALAAGRARGWLTGSPGRMTAIERVGGVCVIGVGVSVAVGGHRP